MKIFKLTIILLVLSLICLFSKVHAQNFDEKSAEISKLLNTHVDSAKVELDKLFLLFPYKDQGIVMQSEMDILRQSVLLNATITEETKTEIAKSLEKYLEIENDSIDKVSFLNNMGKYYYQQNQIDSSLQYYLAATDKLKDGKLNPKYAILMNNISGLYKRLKDYNKASKYIKEALFSCIERGDSTYISPLASNLAGSYRSELKPDSARKYVNLALDVALKKKQIRWELAANVIIADMTHYTDRDTAAAIELFKESYKKADKAGYKVYKYKAAKQLSQLITDSEQQLKYAKESYEYYSDNYKYAQTDAGKTLVDAFRKNNKDSEALELLSQLYDAQDSILQKNYAETKMELLTKYETADKEAEIARQEQQLAESKLYSNRLILGLLVAGLTGLLLFIYILYKNQKDKLVQEENEKRLAQLETMVLKSQMNPHFIFNSLNSIRYLFMKDQKDKGLKYITKFAKLLRSTLNQGEHALVTLKEEVELTELYISLEQLRFDGEFIYTKEAETADWEEFPIPPFVLQPIVENSFWHGLGSSKEPTKRLSVQIVNKSDTCQITVQDNGVGFGESENTKVPELNKNKSYGLNIIRERFDLLSKITDHTYEVTTDTSKLYKTGAMVIITIRKRV